MPNLGGWELIILLGVVVLIFGAKRLPDMARSIGQSARVFKGEIKGLKSDTKDPATPVADDAAAAQPSGTAVAGAKHAVDEAPQAERSAVPAPAAPASGAPGIR